jgi:hypothetical protein
MMLTGEYLRGIIKEEVGEFFEADAGSDQGGDNHTEPAADEGPSKNVKKAEGKLQQYLSLALEKIKNEEDLKDVMTTFLEMASSHPALTTNKVRLVLISLAKQVVVDAKQKNK